MRTSPRFSSTLILAGGLGTAGALALFVILPGAGDGVFFAGALGTFALTIAAIFDLAGSRGPAEASPEAAPETAVACDHEPRGRPVSRPHAHSPMFGAGRAG